jgi:hypothetical protein
MDPSTLLIMGFTYVAAQIGRKGGDEVAGVVWTKAKNAWAMVFVEEPQPSAVTRGRSGADEAVKRGRRTMQCTGPGLAMLAPSGGRFV